MAKSKRDGLLIAGGGLAGSLAALAMARGRPDVPILLVEEGEAFGGQHTMSFFESDIDEADRWLAEPLIGPRWPGYYLAFRAWTRKGKTELAGIPPIKIEHEVREGEGRWWPPCSRVPVASAPRTRPCAGCRNRVSGRAGWAITSPFRTAPAQ